MRKQRHRRKLDHRYKRRNSRLRFPDYVIRLRIIIRDKYKCRYCGTGVTEYSANIDHVVPYHLGGPTSVENMVTACRECNKKKGAFFGPKPYPVTHHKWDDGTKCYNLYLRKLKKRGIKPEDVNEGLKLSLKDKKELEMQVEHLKAIKLEI